MRHDLDLTRVEASIRGLALRAAFGGNLRPGGVWEVDVHGNCSCPLDVFHGSPVGLGGRPYQVRTLVPCRRCENCLQFRQMQWRERILYEMLAAPYTTFLTLTFSPAHFAGVLAAARTPSRADVEIAAYGHVKLYWKRLRKGRSRAFEFREREHRAASGTKAPTKWQSLPRKRQVFDPLSFRFFACAEYGEERGRLHFHAVVHHHRWIPPEVFANEWRSRSDASLVQSRAGCATYVSKYLTKDQTPGRARPSLKYGYEVTPRAKRAARTAYAVPAHVFEQK